MTGVDLCDENYKMFTHFGVDLGECRLTTVELRAKNITGLYRENFVPLKKCRLRRNVDLCTVELCEVDCISELKPKMCNFTCTLVLAESTLGRFS